MVLSLNCIILGDTTTFPITLGDKITLDDMQYNIDVFRISNLKQYIFSKKKESKLSGISDPDDLVLWKVNVSKDKLKGVYTTEHIMNKLNGENMDEVYFISQYFDVNQHPDTNIHIIVVPPAATAGPSQKGIPQYVEIRRKEEVLSDAESHWENLKDKLIETIELEEFRVSNHIYKDNINASGIPVINNEPRFILHSLPDSDDEQGYLDKEILNALFNDVMRNPWLFLLGTSGSGKTRSLYELLCKTFGIYLSLSAGNGSKNLGSKDMDVSISELSVYLTNDPEKNTIYALRFTHAILLGRLFILNKLLVYNQGCNRNFTPKQWLLLQLLPIKISGEDFWIPMSRVFRELKQQDQDELIRTFINKFHTLIPEQGKLPIAIDESQVAITKHQARFSTTLADGQLRPFFAILLRTVLNLSTGNLCLVLSGTGMSFDDINNYTASAIAKSGGATYNNFFSMHDGFYKYEEMKEFIQRFLPLDDKLIRATFNIFRGRRRFVIQFLEHALKGSSTFKSNIDEIVKDWQDKARDFIIKTFMDSCFPRLHKKKEAWSKMRDIVILSLFSHDTILMKGDGVSQMVQYGFAQLDNIRHLADLNTLNENAITVRIAEPIPIIAFREYLNKHPNELETQLYQNLNSVHYNAVCAGFLFEPCLTIHLAELFNGKICRDHILFKNIDNMNKLDLLLSCKTTIRNLDDCNATTLCSEGSMEKENLPAFLENPTTAFFKPESVAGPDLVCIVQFHTIYGIIEIPLFLQAKLVKNKPSTTAKDTTNPNYFYAHDGPTPEPKRELKKKGA